MLTPNDIKMININYYNNTLFKDEVVLNNCIMNSRICYWQKRNVIITYIMNNIALQKLLIDENFTNINNNIKINNSYNYLSQLLYQEIFKHLSKRKYYQYVFCGYSLGGTIASIILFRFINDTLLYDYDYNLITYGSRPAGNKNFTNFIQNVTNIYRYKNSGDYIKYPQKYKQPGKLIKLQSDDSALNTHSLQSYYINLKSQQVEI